MYEIDPVEAGVEVEAEVEVEVDSRVEAEADKCGLAAILFGIFRETNESGFGRGFVLVDVAGGGGGVSICALAASFFLSFLKLRF